MKENQSKMWLCINFIIDQAMMENYKFVWHVPDSDTYVIYIFVIKKKCSDRVKSKLIKYNKSLLLHRKQNYLPSQFPKMNQ